MDTVLADSNYLAAQIRCYIFGPIIIAACLRVWHTGVPWTAKTRIQGTPGKVLASIGIAIGAGMILFAVALHFGAFQRLLDSQ